MWKILGIILMLIVGLFVAGMFRPLLHQLTTNASAQTDSGDTFALALLGTFVVLPLIWIFVRGMYSLLGRDKD